MVVCEIRGLRFLRGTAVFGASVPDSVGAGDVLLDRVEACAANTLSLSRGAGVWKRASGHMSLVILGQL